MKEKKLNQGFIIESFTHENTLKKYEDAVDGIGLWESEKIFFQKYINRKNYILDLGCGAGRTTFGLVKLGYENILGVDLTPAMIQRSKAKAEQLDLNINFELGDACGLNYGEGTFDACIFSFNGIMQIPKRRNRIKAMKEISRVLKEEGVFIFTTHDRDASEEWSWYWEEETERWRNNQQDQRLYEFGDGIVQDGDRYTFLHFPTRDEVIECLGESGLILVEDQWLPDITVEPEQVRKFISDCRFWVAKKTLNSEKEGIAL